MGLKVLVADDASFVRDTIKRGLRQIIPDLELFEAVNGKKAISTLKSNKVDVVLSDWEMPEMNGDEVLRWLREQAHYEKTPFIMITSRGDRENVVQAVQNGVSDYMTKPFSPEELHRKVNKQLKRIGYTPPKRTSAAADATMSSLQALTSGKTETLESQSSSTANKPNPKKAAAAKTKTKQRFDCRVQLRFSGSTSGCVISELSLQAMTGFIVRQDKLPTLFEQAVVDLEDPNGNALGRLNAYVHSMQALENHPDTKKLKTTLRFVDNDPEKMALISKIISQT
jgi:DNA-binding response OmpR family regulator